MRKPATLGLFSSRRVTQVIADSAETRCHGTFFVLKKPAVFHQLRFHSTEHDYGRVGVGPISSFKQKSPARSVQKSIAPSLSPLSQCVRLHLAAHPPPSSSRKVPDEKRNEGEEELWVVDQLLRLLLSHPVNIESAPVTEGLHPLLCVRVLQRLGYAVWTSVKNNVDTKNNTIFNVAHSTKGWSNRYLYPSLTLCSPTTADNAPLSPFSSSQVRQAQALATVTAVVLCPLLPLLGDGTPQRPPHTQVEPVVPLILEWLCTLPTSEAAIPVQQWLPWMVNQYATRRYSRDSEGQSDCDTALPPLEELLPPLIRKLAPFLNSKEAPSLMSNSTNSSLAALCERQLSLLFQLCRHSISRTARSSGTMLADALWWSGDKPLLCLPGVRRALAHFTEQDVKEAGVHLPSTTSADGDEKTKCDVFVNSGVLGKSLASISEVGGGVSFVQLPFSVPNGSSKCNTLPQLTLRIADDDVYRRFLLRLTALQHTFVEERQAQQQQLDVCHTNKTKNDATVLLSLELDELLLQGVDGSAERSDTHDDPDVILRFVQPLYEYVMLLEDNVSAVSSASTLSVLNSSCENRVSLADAPVRLAFTAVTKVLVAAFRRLEKLKQQSRCHYAAAANPVQRTREADNTPSPGATTSTTATAYTLLPQKTRLHTLKRLCEVLLHHVRDVEDAREVALRKTPAQPLEYKKTSLLVGTQLWFVDVDGRQQEGVMRRLCGAARALVRVVMEERRTSLLEEGPEGSVLIASSITAAHRTCPGTLGMSGADVSKEETSVVNGGAMPTAAVVTARETPTTASIISFDHTLRTLAFRVVEPALWALYDTCSQHTVSLPLHVLTFDKWLSYLKAVSGEGILEVGSGNGSQGKHGSSDVGNLAQQGREVSLTLHSYTAAMKAAQSVYESVGGRPGLQTAQQVLPRPGQQSISALVEGIRLTALQCFVFDGLRIDASSSLTDRLEDKDAYAKWVLEYTSAAFFSVWQRTAPQLVPVAVNREMLESVEEGQRRLRQRLGLLTLALHIHVLLLTQQQFCSVKAGGVIATHRTGAIHHLPSSLRSLLQCLMAGSTPTSFSSSVSPPFSRHHHANSDNDSCLDLSGVVFVDEWSLVLFNGAVLQSCQRPPSGTPSGCTSQWELVEELEELVAVSLDEVEAADDAPGVGGVTWRWLGSPEALWATAEEVTADAATASSSSRFFLLPWTTVAHSHQLFRVYDESGQSQRVALEWEAALQDWLTRGNTSSSDNHFDSEIKTGTASNTKRSSTGSRPVVRLVSIAEELRFFSALRYQPAVQLTSSMRVVCEEVQREVEAIAPAVHRQLQSLKDRQTRATSGEKLKPETGWYTEDDYDGLD